MDGFDPDTIKLIPTGKRDNKKSIKTLTATCFVKNPKVQNYYEMSTKIVKNRVIFHSQIPQMFFCNIIVTFKSKP